MNILDRLKDVADRNGDGKIDASDLESLKGEADNGEEGGILDKIKGAADRNGDGKLSLDDAKSMIPGMSSKE